MRDEERVYEIQKVFFIHLKGALLPLSSLFGILLHVTPTQPLAAILPFFSCKVEGNGSTLLHLQM